MKSSRYIAVEWRHTRIHDPIFLISEVADGGWEQRKVEVFRDGTKGYADSNFLSVNTRLGEAPVPDVSEIAKSLEFSPRLISREEFERVWAEAHS